MININKLTIEDYGRWVKFRNPCYGNSCYGRIKFWNKKYIFIVVIGILIQDEIGWENSSYVSVNPKDLKFVEAPTKYFIYC